MSDSYTQVLICQVDSEANHTGRVKRGFTYQPEIFMVADALTYDGESHPVKRREVTIDDQMIIETITLLVY